MSRIDYNALAQLAARAASECLSQARREQRSNDVHLVNSRVIACDASGAQVGPVLGYPEMHKLTGTGLAHVVILNAPAQFDHIAIDGEAIDGTGDQVGYWGVDSRELAGPGERIPADETQRQDGPSVSTRINWATIKQQHRSAS